jgi:hypothetical protein
VQENVAAADLRATDRLEGGARKGSIPIASSSMFHSIARASIQSVCPSARGRPDAKA